MLKRPVRNKARCAATPAALAAQLEPHPATGMPFGLPAICEEDFATLKSWVADGSPGPDEAARQTALAAANPEAVATWEAFFNADDPRTRQVSRYIFQHVFLTTIVLADSPGDQFRLVRSSTPPVRIVEDAKDNKRVESPPVKVIGTGLPYDDPTRTAMRESTSSGIGSRSAASRRCRRTILFCASVPTIYPI